MVEITIQRAIMVEIGRKKVGISPNSFSVGCTKLENGKIVEYMPYYMAKHTQKKW
jgi:hypothetical protein